MTDTSQVKIRVYNHGFGPETGRMLKFLLDEAAQMNHTSQGILNIAAELREPNVTTLIALGPKPFSPFAAEEIIGFAALKRVQRETRSHTAYLRLHVRRGERGHNIGGDLLDAALAKADEMDIRRVVAAPYSRSGAKWRSDEMTRRKVDFFRRHGFKYEGVSRDFAKTPDGYTDAVMLARLKGES